MANERRNIYVLVAIVKKRLRFQQRLYTNLQILGLSLFEKMPVLQALSQMDYTIQDDTECKQLDLFDF